MLSIKTLENLKTCEKERAIIQIAQLEDCLHQHGAWSKDSIKDILQQDNNHGLLLHNDFVICYCLYQQVFEVAEILRIGTHPDYQRQGLAQQLIKAFITKVSANQADRILLEVAADNLGAIGLYTKMGFKAIDTRKGYYRGIQGQSIDALIMQYTI